MKTPGSDQPRSNTPKHPVQQRLTKEKRWGIAQKDFKRLRKQATYSGMAKEEGEAWAWAELDRLFPGTLEPSQPQQIARETIEEELPKEIRSTAQIPIETINQPIETTDQSTITGLDKIPGGWLPLPGNASLQAEISWVQANRLLIVKEMGNGTVVSLRKAMGPPPSWAALGWLETSIRTYAKFVEVAAKATASIASEEEEVKRERVAIEEVRRLLNEMLEPGDV